MIWASIDPATRSGLAYWDGARLTRTDVLRPIGSKGKWTVAEEIYTRRFEAYSAAVRLCEVVVVERGAGRFASAIWSQGQNTGYIRAAVESMCHGRYAEVNVSEWRRVIREDTGVSWPATTERKKALSVSLVARLYGIDVSDDEADAVLLGRAALRMGVVS